MTPAGARGRSAAARRRLCSGRCPPSSCLAVLAYLPYVPSSCPGVLPGRVNGPGLDAAARRPASSSAGIALSYDVLFGRTGLLSFGHALFVAAGSYLLTISLSTWSLPLLARGRSSRWACPTLLALVVGAIALRVGGIAFAMVTLAFAQAASIIVMRNPGGVTGGEEGTAPSTATPCPTCSSASPTRRTATGSPWASSSSRGSSSRCSIRSRAGHAMAAVRENEQRAAVLGFGTYRVKLLAIVVGSFLGALGGVVHALVLGGSNPHLTTSEFTLSLLVMVVLGGAGSRWGAVLGGVLYTYADARLVEVEQRRRSAGPARRSCVRCCRSRSSSSASSSSSSSTSRRPA